MQLTIRNDKNREFTIRTLTRGDRYGRNNCLVWSEYETGVEVYDATYNFTQYGQFVSRYYLSTLLEGNSRTTGINLHGGEPVWNIDSKNWNIVIKWLESINTKESKQW